MRRPRNRVGDTVRVDLVYQTEGSWNCIHRTRRPCGPNPADRPRRAAPIPRPLETSPEPPCRRARSPWTFYFAEVVFCPTFAARSTGRSEIAMKKPVSGKIALGRAIASVETAGVSSRFRVHSAWLEVMPTGTTPVHLHLEGKRGTLKLELPLIPAWLLSADIHERAIGLKRTADRNRPAGNKRKNPEG